MCPECKGNAITTKTTTHRCKYIGVDRDLCQKCIIMKCLGCGWSDSVYLITGDE